MATQSKFDPDNVDPEFYSKNPAQHGDADYGRESEGVGTNAYKDSTSGMDMEAGNRNATYASREANVGEGDVDKPVGETYGSTQGWDVDPSVSMQNKEKRGLTNAESQRLEETPDNPSDEALFHRADATYLEQSDDPNTGYDPHNKGYDGASGK